MVEVVTMGEAMVGFTPSDGKPLRQATAFHRFIGGAESNVAIGVAKMEHRAGWLSRLGHDMFGQQILHELQAHGVDTSRVVLSREEPTAVYFKDRSDVSDRVVVYYRKGSAMSRITPEDLDAAYIAGARIFHVTGITLALSESSRETVRRALAIAQAHGVTVSFDPNYRPALWCEEEAREAYAQVLPQVDILITTVEEAVLLAGGVTVDSDPQAVLEKLAALGPKAVYLKQGEIGAMYAVGGEVGQVPAVKGLNVVDTVGAGDAFAAGVLVGHLEGLSPLETVRIANAMGGSATTTLGDYDGVPQRAELMALVERTYGA